MRRVMWIGALLAFLAMMMLPFGVSAAEPEIVYVVTLGDTLSHIGLKYGVPWPLICEANKIVNCNLIYPGQRLVIPTASGQVGHIAVLSGFTPDPELIDISDQVSLPEVPADITLYRTFPDVDGAWGKPRVGYNFGYNDACRDVSRQCNLQIPTWSWVVVTGEEISLPGIGSLRNPDGGAVLAVLINVWEVPGEFEEAYILHGWWGTGEVWDMSDMTTKWDANTETYVNDIYGTYTLETLAVLRNHYLYQLGSTEPNPEFRGQCGSGTQCASVTWACVLRWYDGSFRLVANDQWVRN